MICPKCNINLEGELIYKTFLKKYKDKKKALKIAKMYGATSTKGRWGREIGISDMMLDKIIAWRCPDCCNEWK
jgi:hypothetical protein